MKSNSLTTIPLTVYKASAGSGKTFTLALEYMKLLIANPQNYRSILAVTFTNKATDEMKTRILSQLYGLHRHLPDSNQYLERIVAATGLAEEEVRRRAGEALSLLTHNYSYFRVETIDSFFQSVLRNLARELDLTANLKVELNDYQVEQKAVDELIQGLERSSNILRWILDYIEENISEDKNWNVVGQIKKFGEQIFKDIYKEKRDKLTETINRKDFFKGYVENIRAIRHRSKEQLVQRGQQFETILRQNGATVADFSNGKSGVCGYFLKLQKGIFDEKELLKKRVTDGMDDTNKWLKKEQQSPSHPLYALVETQLRPLLLQTEQERPRLLRMYNSSELTLRHLNELRLLSSIEQKVHELNSESNSFLLSDTQQLLHALINDADSPFIFEKIGTQLEHIMIDEFQDTSTLQWENFRVLLKECMSHEGSSNLLVGDVKQSIYRWRSSDWGLLNDIERQFDNNKEMVRVEDLKTNYRSDPFVVRFNNAFFLLAKQMEYEQLHAQMGDKAEGLERAYAAVEQAVRANAEERGFVRMELIPTKEKDDALMERLATTVNELVEAGVGYGSMAFLVRSNQEARDIVRYFGQHLPEIPLMSDEAFCLEASVAVRMLVDALHVLANPDDVLAVNRLAWAYQAHVLGNESAKELLLLHKGDVWSLLPPRYAQAKATLPATPLYELAEQLYAMFGLNALKGQTAYVCAFFDHLIEFAKDGMPTIRSLEEYWEQTLRGKSIQSDETAGIRILTIHKSKGLEFDHVMIPFCDWKLENMGTLWCEPTDAPFDELPLVPVKYGSRQMVPSVYEDSYFEEHLQNTVDNLNLLYVAFTRAKRGLYVMGKRGGATMRSHLLEKVLERIQEQLPDAHVDAGEGNKEDCLVLEYGASANAKTHSRRAEQAGQRPPTSNVFLRPSTPINIEVNTYASQVGFRQSNKSKDFIGGDDHDSQRQEYVQLGNVLHRLFAMIRTVADAPKAIEELGQEGVLNQHDLSREGLLDVLNTLFKQEQVRDWFSGEWETYLECNILCTDPVTGELVERRPDRVMMKDGEVVVVDYKFGQAHARYHDQVGQYMQLIQQMGHPRVKGYLWYVFSNRIEEVI